MERERERDRGGDRGKKESVDRDGGEESDEASREEEKGRQKTVGDKEGLLFHCSPSPCSVIVQSSLLLFCSFKWQLKCHCSVLAGPAWDAAR